MFVGRASIVALSMRTQPDTWAWLWRVFTGNEMISHGAETCLSGRDDFLHFLQQIDFGVHG